MGCEMKKILIAGFCLIVIFTALRWNSAPFFAVKKYHCSQTGVIAPDYFSSIETVAGNLLRDKNSSHSIIKQLQQQFPILNKIILSYRPHSTHISLYARKPVCCINNFSIITSDGEFFPKDNFSDDIYSVIPAVAVAPHYLKNAAPQILSFLQELPSDFDQHYDLRLENEHMIHLIDKEKPQFTIIFAAAQKNMKDLLSRCAVVKNNLDARKRFDKDMHWVADARFESYIILHPMLH
jgi:hypothetical protein